MSRMSLLITPDVTVVGGHPLHERRCWFQTGLVSGETPDKLADFLRILVQQVGLFAHVLLQVEQQRIVRGYGSLDYDDETLATFVT